jgi:DNA-binding SARP family transcriptional activator
LLGPVEILAADRRLDMGRPRQRCVLAALLVDVNQVVPVTTLIDRVWGEDPPKAVRSGLYSYLARLRPAVAAAGGRLVHASGGYLLEADRDTVDIHRFRALVIQAARQSAVDHRIILLDEALRLWHGTPFGDLSTPWIDSTRETLIAEHRAALLGRNELLIRQGRPAEVVAELREATASHPFDERMAEQLMLALYSSGQRAAALEYYQQVRKTLTAHLGVDPGPELWRLHQQVLRNEPVLPSLSAAEPAKKPTVAVNPAQLPHDVWSFIGRADVLARLNDALTAAPGDHAPGTILVSAIEGAAGVGKTALGIHVAHRLADHFPDGQLYADLRGYDASQAPLSPAAVLGQFLRALQVPPRQIPTSLDELAALYRSLLAGRRILVMLDNAATSEQVRPLLPGTPMCRTIVTSRNLLEGLAARDGAYRVVLDVLSPDDATALLRHIMGTRRTADESGAVAELARLCAYLPLALRIAAERVASSASVSLTSLIGQLADERNRLGTLAARDDEGTAVPTVLSWSYRALPPDAARAFRLLGLHPGPDISPGAAAALTDTPADQATRLLTTLAGVHLVEQKMPGRYDFHDLLRVYAAELCRGTESPGERNQAVERLLNWYLSGASAADAVLAPHRRRDHLYPAAGQGYPFVFPSHNAALDWLESERPNMVAASRLAAAAGLSAAWKLPVLLGSFFNLRKHWLDWIATHETGLDAARRAGDRRGEAWTMTGLGITCWDLRRVDEAIGYYQRALDIHRETEDKIGEAATLNNLGIALGDKSQFAEAAQYLQESLLICRMLGDRWSEGMTLDSLGVAFRDLGRRQDAIDCLSAAAEVCRETGNRRGEGFALDNLGDVYRAQLSPETAAEHYERALAIRQDIGDRQGEASTLTKLGDLGHEAGQPDRAVNYWRRALMLLEELGDPGAGEVSARLRAIRG